MRTASMTRLTLLSIAILVVTACDGSAGRPSSAAIPSAPAAGGARPSSPAGPARAGGGALDVWLLAGRAGETGLHLVLASTGESAMDLPAGSPRSGSNWDHVMTATPDGDATTVRDSVIEPGLIEPSLEGPQVRIDGHWRLPTIGLDPIPAGRSLDGSTVVVVEGGYDPGQARSRFAVVQHAFANDVSTDPGAPLRLARIVELPGAFEYDTLSPDGRILYVVEHLDASAGGRYQVRAVDVATGVLRDGVIVDKTNVEESMAGSPIAQVRRPDGVVLTLYRGPDHPFVHVLNAKEAWAVCIDLPRGGRDAGAGAGDAAGLDWGMTSDTFVTSVYAVNASLGLAVEIDPANLTIRRSATIPATATGPAADSIVLAKFGHGEFGPIGRRVVAAPDGTALFAAGASGVTVIRTKDLGVLRTDLTGSTIDGLGITPDGATLFALLRGSGQIVAVDARTGHRLGTIPGAGYDRLVAVAPA
jgi:hypothetical protein